jgi:hypothetical protein
MLVDTKTKCLLDSSYNVGFMCSNWSQLNVESTIV